MALCKFDYYYYILYTLGRYIPEGFEKKIEKLTNRYSLTRSLKSRIIIIIIIIIYFIFYTLGSIDLEG